jgi:hypothetical protein
MPFDLANAQQAIILQHINNSCIPSQPIVGRRITQQLTRLVGGGGDRVSVDELRALLLGGDLRPREVGAGRGEQGTRVGWRGERIRMRMLMRVCVFSDRTQTTRRFVVVSLAEAETLRRILHLRQVCHTTRTHC